jgi:RND family efflux transporter MFP subunit
VVKRLLTTLLALALLGGGGWYGYSWWRDHQAAKEAAVPKGATATVERRKIEYKIESSGDIAPAVEVEVKPEVSARVKRLLVEVGTHVKKDQTIVELDDTDLQTEKRGVETEIAGAQVSLDKAERNFERARQLFERKLISQEAFENLRSDRDTAQNNHAKARSRLQTVQDKISKTVVLSPMEGTVLTVPVVEGQVVVAAASVNSGTLLMTIADLNRMYITTHINQVDVSKIQPEQAVDLRIESLPEAKMKGRVSLISPIASVVRNVKGFTVTVWIENLDPAVRPGMTAEITFPIRRIDNALALPLSAIFTEDDDSTVVYIVGRGTNPNEPRKIPIKVGVSDFDFAEIKEGLNEGDVVLLVRPSAARGPGAGS